MPEDYKVIETTSYHLCRCVCHQNHDHGCDSCCAGCQISITEAGRTRITSLSYICLLFDDKRKAEPEFTMWPDR